VHKPFLSESYWKSKRIKLYNQIQSKPTAAYYISLIGGILGLIVGLFTILAVIGIWISIASIIIIVASQKLMREPTQHTSWGIIILVFSIITPGNILGIIGGILALVFNPAPVGTVPPAQPYAPYGQPQKPITRVCPQCGFVLDEDAKFCTHCGKQVS
jgi:hypothetical protein